MNEKILTLFSSDHTKQYEKDVFSVLSLPRGCKFQFRYEKNYVEDSVKAIFTNNRDLSKYRALVAFRSSSDTQFPKSFIIPIRWVRIDSIESISNGGWAVYFITEGYPKFTYEFSNISTMEQLSTSAESIFNSLGNGNRDLAVLSHAINLVDLDMNKSSEERDRENWFDIIKSISIIDKYKKMHFLKCSKFYTLQTDSNQTLTRVYNNSNNFNIEMVEKKPSYIDVEYYSLEYDNAKNDELVVLINDKIINKTNGLRNALDSRYGTKTIGFQPQSVPHYTYTEIVISTKGSNDDLNTVNTELSFPIVVEKNKVYRGLKAFMMAVGGLFVALPGIVQTSVTLNWNIGFAAIGALILGITSYWESKE